MPKIRAGARGTKCTLKIWVGGVVWCLEKKENKIRLGCPAGCGKAAGWALWALDLMNIKSIPG